MALDSAPVPVLGNQGGPAPEEAESSLYWRQQHQIACVSRENAISHSYARLAAMASKGPGLALPNVADLALQLAKEDFLAKQAQQQPTTPGKRPGNPTFLEKREQKQNEHQRHINEDLHHQYWTSLDCSGQGVFTISPKVMNYDFLQKLYLNHNNIAEVPKCISQLSQLRVLDLSSNLLQTLPAEIGVMSNLRVLLLFDNRIEHLPFELGSLFQLQMLGILGNPWVDRDTIGTKVFTEGGTRALIEFLRDRAPVGSPPNPREWVHMNSVTKESHELSVMSYNTLCAQYATSTLYGYTPSWALRWDYRSQLLIKDVLSLNTDIVCLQEVNGASLDEVWIPVMEARGYKLLYYAKTRSRTMSSPKESKLVDGCATFYRKSKLKLVEKYPVEFNSRALLKDDLKKSVDIFNRVMTRDNIAIIGVFEHIGTGKQVVVANTHLHWDPAFKDVKLVQTALLMEETERLARKYAKQNYNNDLKQVPVLIAGDFNSSPDSGVVQLFNHSSVPHNHEDMDGHSYGNYTAEGHGISHALPVKTAYPPEMQLPFTNYTPDFVEMIDYIVYSISNMKVNALLGKVDVDYAKKYVGFPNAHHPSDHVPIAAKFEFV